MLVTLGVNESISASSQKTFTYSPSSLQSVQIRMGDTDWEQSTITVQLGSVTICNGASAWGLAGLTGLYSNLDSSVSNNAAHLNIDFGSHQCTDRDNLYVTVTAGAADLTGYDISAVVDKPGEMPLRVTEYSDNTFVSPANLCAISFDSAFQTVENDDIRCEIRTPVSSSSPSFVSASSYYNSICATKNGGVSYGLLNKNDVPLETSYNYASGGVTDRILTVEAMPSSAEAKLQSDKQAKIIESQKAV